MGLQAKRLGEVLLQLPVPQRAALSQGVPDLTGSLLILPRQRQVEPQGGAIRSLVQVDEMLAEAAQQAGLPRAFGTCERDEAGWEREQFGGRHHVRTIARLAPSDSAPAAVWTLSRDNGGKFASINRPVAGATHDKELPVGRHPLQLYCGGSNSRWRCRQGRRNKTRYVQFLFMEGGAER